MVKKHRAFVQIGWLFIKTSELLRFSFGCLCTELDKVNLDSEVKCVPFAFPKVFRKRPVEFSVFCSTSLPILYSLIFILHQIKWLGSMPESINLHQICSCSRQLHQTMNIIHKVISGVKNGPRASKYTNNSQDGMFFSCRYPRNWVACQSCKSVPVPSTLMRSGNRNGNAPIPQVLKASTVTLQTCRHGQSAALPFKAQLIQCLSWSCFWVLCVSTTISPKWTNSGLSEPESVWFCRPAINYSYFTKPAATRELADISGIELKGLEEEMPLECYTFMFMIVIKMCFLMHSTFICSWCHCGAFVLSYHSTVELKSVD